MSNHGRWRFHANLDDITWNREVETMKIRAKDGYQYEPAWLSPRTAEARGIKHGDIVKVYNERGTVLCGAYVTPRLVDGVVYVDHGSRFDPIDAEKLDRGRGGRGAGGKKGRGTHGRRSPNGRRTQRAPPSRHPLRSATAATDHALAARAPGREPRHGRSPGGACILLSIQQIRRLIK